MTKPRRPGRRGPRGSSTGPGDDADRRAAAAVSPMARPGHDAELVARVLSQARRDVLEELERVFARRRGTGYGPLYDLLADYPFREGKGVRPAICFASCRAVGGRTEQALLSASALELFHNAFLVHDDIEDGSEFRRGRATMLKEHGAPVAINVGDATNVLALELLLGNTAALGVRKALLVLREVERMARESAEGQAIELGWIADGRFDLERPGLRAHGLQEDLLVHRDRAAAHRRDLRRAPGPGRAARRRADPADRARVPRRHRLPDPRRPAQPRGRRGALRQGDERRPVGGQADGHAPALPAHRPGGRRARARCGCCGRPARERPRRMSSGCSGR